jgi:Fe-S-cluster containining protein
MKSFPNSQTQELPEALRDKRSLKKDESFCFSCSKDLDCFTGCCADINIVLTPADVLRLSRRLNLTTTEFLARHALVPITKDLHLPVVILKMEDTASKKCSFVSDAGCSVYEDRPWSCRMYPVGMALPPARAGEDPKPVYFLFEDDFCLGHTQKQEWTVAKWLDDQGITKIEELEAGYQEIVGHPWFIGGRQLDAKRMEMFHMACYDLDRFRQFVFNSTFLERFELEDDYIDEIRNNDEALLNFAYRWLRFALFTEPTLTVKKEYQNRQGGN